ncbi:MAG TPA: energy-coupling factor transporter transmembrane component T, partial [Saliniramus sp.]|nr:energy-coupling factor transporter transmembrane component T [Saliniramus sp.]
FIGGTLVFVFDDWMALAALAGFVLALYAVARIPPRLALAQIRPAVMILIAIFALHAIFGEWLFGVFVVARFAVVIMLAALVTLTTRVSDMVAALETGLGPARHIGVDPSRVALAVAMAIRFIPVIATEAAAIREAQAARGLHRSFVAILVPLMIRSLRMADSVAEALDARGFETKRDGRLASQENSQLKHPPERIGRAVD